MPTDDLPHSNKPPDIAPALASSLVTNSSTTVLIVVLGVSEIPACEIWKRCVKSRGVASNYERTREMSGHSLCRQLQHSSSAHKVDSNKEKDRGIGMKVSIGIVK